MQPTTREIDEVKSLVQQALVPYNLKPRNEDIARITDGLLTHGQRYVARATGLDRAPRVVHALQDWHDLTRLGPEDNPLGNWNYARGLARVIRILHNALLEDGRRRELTAQPGLPCLAPSADANPAR